MIKNHNAIWYIGTAVLLYLGVAYTGGPKLLGSATSGAAGVITALQGRSTKGAQVIP